MLFYYIFRVVVAGNVLKTGGTAGDRRSSEASLHAMAENKRLNSAMHFIISIFMAVLGKSFLDESLR